MSPERWKQVSAVFHAALARDAAMREAALDDACAGDVALRAEVEALLAAHREAGAFGDAPVFVPPEDSPRFQPGQALGPYRIEALVETGGMGEVYRARDTRLDRTVAVKVVRAQPGADPSLAPRLEREARVLATISHPHICPIFDVGRDDGVGYLVMEFLEGETLEKRLAKGALPLDVALRHAAEIADALEVAHGHGIVHRDLKPANVMLTKGGARVLDFGLAKLQAAPPLAALAAGAPEAKPLTRSGTILGTLQYMAPEQLNGEEVDARTDIFALGAVVHEMVTGGKAFSGKTPASLVAAILEREPAPVSTLRPMSPPALDHLVRTCLAKDPQKRWRSAGDVALQLGWILADSSAAPSGTAEHPASRVRPALALAAAAALSAGLTAWVARPAPPSGPRPVRRFELQLPEGQDFRNADRPVVALSADGRRVAYNTTKGVYVRSFADAEARLVPGTEDDVFGPFFSPDGEWIGFFSGGKLKKVPAAGGTPIALCDAEKPLGARWGTDGTIVYGQSGGIARVSANGGTPESLIHAREGETLYGPEVLPGGDWVLFTSARQENVDESDRAYRVILRRWDEASVVAQSIRSGERKVLWTGGSDAKYVPSGHLAFAVGDALYAAPFDLHALQVTGKPVPVATDVLRPVRRQAIIEAGSANYALSDDGTLVHVQREGFARNRVPALVTRDGAVERLGLRPAPYVNPRISPDGRRLALQTLEEDGRGDIWIYDLSGTSQVRQLTTGGDSWFPLWTPDSRRVTFVSAREGRRSIYWQLADGSALAERLTTAAEGTGQRPDSWSPDGRILAYRVYENQRASIWTLARGGETREVYSPGPGVSAYEAAFSPDGKWLAYTSTETGADQISIMPFPGPGASIRLTREGGAFPIWSPDGRELFYRHSFHKQISRTQGARLFSLPIRTRGTVAFGAERALPLEGFLVFNTYRDYDITPDGSRFLLIYHLDSPARPPRINVVQNWFEELKARVPLSHGP